MSIAGFMVKFAFVKFSVVPGSDVICSNCVGALLAGLQGRDFDMTITFDMGHLFPSTLLTRYVLTNCFLCQHVIVMVIIVCKCCPIKRLLTRLLLSILLIDAKQGPDNSCFLAKQVRASHEVTLFSHSVILGSHDAAGLLPGTAVLVRRHILMNTNS